MIDQLLSCENLQNIIATYGIAGPFIFIILSTVLLLCFVPRTFLIIVAGVFFGNVWGSFLILLVSLLASYLAFIVGRTFGRRWVEQTFRKRHWFNRLESLNETSGFYVVMIARLAHVIHFEASSYVFGASNVKLRDFIWGTLLGILPGTLVLVYSTRTLGCEVWEKREYLAGVDLYRIVFISVFVFLLTLIPMFFRHKKS